MIIQAIPTALFFVHYKVINIPCFQAIGARLEWNSPGIVVLQLF